MKPTPTELNIAVAECRGWVRGHTGATQWVSDPNGIRMGWSPMRDVADSALPNYAESLDACRELLEEMPWFAFVKNKTTGFSFECDNCGPYKWRPSLNLAIIEAYLRWKGKWREEWG